MTSSFSNNICALKNSRLEERNTMAKESYLDQTKSPKSSCRTFKVTAKSLLSKSIKMSIKKSLRMRMSFISDRDSIVRLMNLLQNSKSFAYAEN
jgi:hypothetical protein